MAATCGALAVRAQGTGDDLQALLSAQQSAVEGGDRDTIVAASRRLAAAAERLQAALLLEDGDAAGAAEMLTRSLTIETSPAAELLLVQCAAEAGHPDQARAAAQRFSASQGDSAAAAMALANAYHTVHDLGETLAELRVAVQRKPDDGAAHLALGTAAWELNEYGYNEESLREFTEAQRLTPAEFLPNFSLGAILSEYHRYVEAEHYLRLATTADASSPDPWLQLGSNAFAEGQNAAAREALETAVRLTGTERGRNNFQIRRAYAMLSRIAADAGRPEEAQRLEKEAEALQREAGQSAAVTPLSESTAVSVAAVRSTAVKQRAAGSAAESRTGAANVGRGEVAGSKEAGAEQHGRLRGELRGVAARSLNDGGTALARERDYAGALPLFREAAREDASVVPVMRNLGLAAFHQAEYAEAVTALEKALEQTPGDTLAERYLQEAKQAVATRGPG